MYGTCETLCRLLNEHYPAETPLNLIVWSPEDNPNKPSNFHELLPTVIINDCANDTFPLLK